MLLPSPLFAVASAAPPYVPPPPDVATAVYLTEYPEAKCLDGSPYAYYIRRAAAGSANVTKWVFHIEGGGWCSNEAGCFGRTEGYLGTSNTSITNFSNISEFGDVGCNIDQCVNLMFNDPVVNEYSYDWNAVFLRYCDGMSFASNKTKPYTMSPSARSGAGSQIWFRGLENLHSTFANLAKVDDLGAATAVHLGGSSAGGLAAYLHADTVQDLIHAANAEASKPPAAVVVHPDSGFWPDDPNERFTAMFQGWFALQDNVTDGLPKHCKWRDTNVTRCLFPQHFADEIEVRLMPLQSLYDPLQAPMSHIDPNLHGDWLLENLNRTVLQTKRADGLANGGFIYSCSRHCGGSNLHVAGFTFPTAVETMLRANAASQPPSQKAFIDHQPYPCKSCCNDAKYPGPQPSP